jgi:hypothetical protein
MYHKGYVALGIILFLALLAMPYWVNAGVPKYENIKDEIKRPEGKCVRDKEWMAAYHMELLNEWRELAVRDGVRHYPTDNGVFNVTLTECWQCHEDYENFCKKCHDFMEVHPVCWECHYNPSVDKPTVNLLK